MKHLFSFLASDLLLRFLTYLVIGIVSFIISSVLYRTSYAQMAVADVGVLAQAKLQYIEALNTVSELRENINQTKQLILDTQNMKEGIGSIRTMMSEVYNNTFGLVGELDRLRDEIARTPQDIQSFMDEFKENADCLFSDMNKYQQVETIYKARYVFRDEYGGTPHFKDDDPYIWEDGSQMAGSFDPVQLTENPCGHTVTYYSQMVKNVEQEKTILNRIYAVWNKTEAEMEQTRTFYKEVQKKVEHTETEKETLDTMKAIMWRMNGHLESIDKTLLDFVSFVVSRTHNPNGLLKAPGLTSEAKTKISMQGIKLGEATEFNKRAQIWKTLERAKKSSVIR